MIVGGNDGCKSGDRGGDWVYVVNVVEVVSGVGMNVGGGGAGSRVDAVHAYSKLQKSVC